MALALSPAWAASAQVEVPTGAPCCTASASALAVRPGWRRAPALACPKKPFLCLLNFLVKIIVDSQEVARKCTGRSRRTIATPPKQEMSTGTIHRRGCFRAGRAHVRVCAHVCACTCVRVGVCSPGRLPQVRFMEPPPSGTEGPSWGPPRCPRRPRAAHGPSRAAQRRCHPSRREPHSGSPLRLASSRVSASACARPRAPRQRPAAPCSGTAHSLPTVPHRGLPGAPAFGHCEQSCRECWGM